MNYSNLTFWGETKLWWLVLIVGILMIPVGLLYMIMPFAGYATAAMLFGWLLVVAGCVQLIVGGGVNRVKARGWWIVGGIVDLLIGFVMVRNILLSERVLPYFLSFIFLYWGIVSIIGSLSPNRTKSWWLQLINGILMLVIGYLFVEGGFLSDMVMIDYIMAVAFIYWGLSLCSYSFALKPRRGVA